MSTTMVQYVTITCDGPECQNTVTFEQAEQAQKDAVQENPWMNGLRFVNMPDGRKMGYCSDVCEIEGVKSGTHNVAPPPPVVTPGNAAQVALAARAAEKARLANEALKSGQGNIKLS